MGPWPWAPHQRTSTIENEKLQHILGRNYNIFKILQSIQGFTRGTLHWVWFRGRYFEEILILTIELWKAYCLCIGTNYLVGPVFLKEILLPWVFFLLTGCSYWVYEPSIVRPRFCVEVWEVLRLKMFKDFALVRHYGQSISLGYWRRFLDHKLFSIVSLLYEFCS